MAVAADKFQRHCKSFLLLKQKTYFSLTEIHLLAWQLASYNLDPVFSSWPRRFLNEDSLCHPKRRLQTFVQTCLCFVCCCQWMESGSTQFPWRWDKGCTHGGLLWGDWQPQFSLISFSLGTNWGNSFKQSCFSWAVGAPLFDENLHKRIVQHTEVTSLSNHDGTSNTVWRKFHARWSVFWGWCRY